MKIRDVIKLSMHHVICGGLKTFLCIIAVFAGVFAFCVACYAGKYAGNTVSKELENLGIKGIAFYSGNKIELSSDDLLDIKGVNGVSNVMPLSVITSTVKMKNNERSALLLSVDDSLEKIWNVKVLFGRAFNKSDMANRRNVAIVDAEYAYDIYKRENIVGREINIQIDGLYEKYEIVGVIKSQKKGIQTLVGTSVPEVVYIPYVNVTDIDMVAISCLKGYDHDDVSTRVKNRIRDKTGLSMNYKNLDIYMDSFGNIIDTVALLAAAFASISLAVGGIGVMSNMLNKAEQRRYEIGVYISLGASKRDICLMFLFESIIICLIGGIAGWIISSLLYDIMGSTFGIALSADGTIATYGIIASTVCGAVFGIFPAVKAASMKPINAIRG